MNCSKCGFQIDDSTKFCPNCGNEIIQDNLLYQENISTIYQNGTPEKDTLENDTPKNDTLEQRAPKKNKIVRSILFMFLLILVLVSVGYVSYHYSFEKYNISTPKKSDKAPLEATDTPSKETSSDKTSSKSSDVPAPKDDTVTTKTNGNYIFPKSANEKLLDSDVKILSKENLALARNEIYGRHGYVFKSEPFKRYFDNKSWYKANSDFKGLPEEFNAVESYNIKLISKFENN
jgi:hypothetical protein